MIQNGRWQTLKFNRKSPHGWYLIDRVGEEVLLPNKYVPEKIIVGQETNVFVYRDSEERLVATYIKPLIELNTYAILDMVADAAFGAFDVLGMEKTSLSHLKSNTRSSKKAIIASFTCT